MNSDSEYIKQIYKKNANWNPPPAPLAIEDSITSFEKTLKEKHNNLTERFIKTNLSNLTPIQAKALRSLRQNKELIIKPSDKNLGPTLMDLDAYISQILSKHLLTKDYSQLSKIEANHRMEHLKTLLKNLIQQNQNLLTKAELTYFDRSLKSHFRLPMFYGLPKVHKTPMSLRPVVSTTNSLLATFSIWLDYKMKTILPLIQSFLKDSYTLIEELKTFRIPETAKIFTADAQSMYTNIDTTTGLATMRDFLNHNKENLPTDFPCTLFLQVLEIVMKNNIFSFAETYWLQLSGTAMGTPAACAYATITFGHFKNITLLPTFQESLLFYRRYIDDVFGIWLPPTHNKDIVWNNFKSALNSWGTLKWSTEEPTTQVHFLDLNITIQNSTIEFSTYQKPLNLYLYIPPLSAHPFSCLKGLIQGELKRYWRQNTTENFQKLVAHFAKRLYLRGHSMETLYPIFLQAVKTLNLPVTLNDKRETDNTLFVHWKHHPHGLQRSDIRQIYKYTLEPNDIHDNMVVAISRPKNLRDTLTKTKLSLPNDKSIQDFITKLKHN
jgi:hypothetical protein